MEFLGCPGWFLKCSGLKWSLDMATNYVRKSVRVIDHHGARVHMHPTALKRFTWALNWPSMIWCVIRFREDYQTVVRPPSANPLSLFSAENHHACISFRPGIHSTIFIQFWAEFWLLQLFLELKTEFQLCCVCVLMCSVRQSDGRMNFLQILIAPPVRVSHSWGGATNWLP